MKTYSQLTEGQRYQIYALKKTGLSNPKIALELGVHRSTINRELKRNTGQRGYRPKQAHRMAQERKKNRSWAKLEPSIWDEVETRLKEDWSPEQISGRLKLSGQSVSHESIYQYVLADQKAGGTLYKHLRHQRKKRKRYGTQERRGSLPNRRSIDDRPEEANERQRIGDWEIDTMIGKNHQGAIVTIVDRKSRYTLMRRVAKRKADVVAEATIKLLQPFQTKVHTITADNGKEFANHQIIAETLESDFYFAHPYASWERGSNENTNGLIRQYIPKKTDFSELDDEQVRLIQRKLNQRPRKVLGFLTPDEVFSDKTNVALTT